MIRFGIESKLLALLVIVSVSSVLATSVIAYISAQATVTEFVYNQLTGLRSSKKIQIEGLFRTVRLQASNLAADRMIIDMMQGLRQGAADLANANVPSPGVSSWTTYYRDDFLPRLQKATGRTPIADAYMPRTNIARYLQYLYIANNPYPPGKNTSWKTPKMAVNGPMCMQNIRKYCRSSSRFWIR